MRYVLLIISVVSFSAWADSNTPTLQDCGQVSGARSLAQSYSNLNQSDLAKNCQDEIKKGLDSCAQPDLSNKSESLQMSEAGQTIQGSGPEAARAMIKMQQMGEQKALTHANSCATSSKEIKKVCDDELKAASDQVQVEGQSSDPAQRGKAFGDLHRIRLIRGSEYSSIRALESSYKCYVNMAEIYNNAANQTDLVQVASSDTPGTADNNIPTDDSYSQSNNNGSQNGGDDGYLNRATDSAKETGLKKGLETADFALEKSEHPLAQAAQQGVKNLKSAASPYFRLGEVSSGDVLGLTGDTASAVAEKIFTPASALRVSGVGLAAQMILDPTPLGKCDTIFTDAVQAFQSNCALTTPAGYQANQNAITTLEQQ